MNAIRIIHVKSCMTNVCHNFIINQSAINVQVVQTQHDIFLALSTAVCTYKTQREINRAYFGTAKIWECCNTNIAVFVKQMNCKIRVSTNCVYVQQVYGRPIGSYCHFQRVIVLIYCYFRLMHYHFNLTRQRFTLVRYRKIILYFDVSFNAIQFLFSVLSLLFGALSFQFNALFYKFNTLNSKPFNALSLISDEKAHNMKAIAH